MNENYWRLVEQAREISERTPEGKTMPAEDAAQVDRLVREMANARKDAERRLAIKEHEQWIATPQYKHDMHNPAGIGSDEPAPTGRGTKSFLDFCRKGLDALPPESKADLVEDSTGQNLVPTDFAGTILKELPREATIRRYAFVRPTSKNKVDVGSVAISTPSWGKLETGATAPDGLAATPASKQTITVHDLTALVKLGRDELEDSDDNLAEIIRSALVLAFAEAEDLAFAGGAGDASNQPWAITHNVTQKVTAAAGNTITPDELKKLTFQVPAQFRRKGVYIAHSGVESAIALLKDGTGRYLLQPSPQLGEPASLFGHPFSINDGLAAPDANATAVDKSCVFGDVYAGYMVADRRRVTVQRLEELYAAQGKVGLMFTHRVGGDVIRPKALAYYEV